jgi:SAM-dependent MidA family methyltransferase
MKQFLKDNWFKVGIIVAVVLCGWLIYQSRINKQESIERQQQIELKAKAEKENADRVFENNLKCQDLLKDLKQRWNNVVGIYYDEFLNTCIVKYTKNGKVEEAPIENMQDI